MENSWQESATSSNAKRSEKGNSGPGDAGIGNDFLVLLLIVASGEEPHLGMMDCWCRRYSLKTKMTSYEE